MQSHLCRRVLNLVVLPWMGAARVGVGARAASSAAAVDEAWGSEVVASARASGSGGRGEVEKTSADWKGKGKAVYGFGLVRRAKETPGYTGRPPDTARHKINSSIDPRPNLTLPSSSSSASSSTTTSIVTPRTKLKSKQQRATAKLPQSLHILLSDRLYRPAFFHLLDTLSNEPVRFKRWLNRGVVLRVLKTFERADASRLAKALRWKVDQVYGDEALEPLTELRARKHGVNTRFSTSISRSVTVPVLGTLEDKGKNPEKERVDQLRSLKRLKPPPSPAQHQVKRLLVQVKSSKLHAGFAPDLVTANIVLKAWLRSIIAPPRPSSLSARVELPRPKETQDKIRKVFEAWSRKTGMPTTRGGYAKVHRPLAKMFIKAFRTTRDQEGVREVIGWLKRVREREGTL